MLKFALFNSVRGVIMDLENFITSTKFGQEFSNIVKNTTTFLRTYSLFFNAFNDNNHMWMSGTARCGDYYQ